MHHFGHLPLKKIKVQRWTQRWIICLQLNDILTSVNYSIYFLCSNQIKKGFAITYVQLGRIKMDLFTPNIYQNFLLPISPKFITSWNVLYCNAILNLYGIVIRLHCDTNFLVQNIKLPSKIMGYFIHSYRTQYLIIFKCVYVLFVWSLSNIFLQQTPSRSDFYLSHRFGQRF